MPKATLYGCDISPDQFPKDDLPPNILFFVASVTDLPAEWTGKFDFASQRMLLGGLQAKDWPVALEQYMRVLKPRGHIQIAEIAPATTAHKRGPFYEKFDNMMQEVCSRTRLLYDCEERLSEMLEKAGFVNVRLERKAAPIGNVRGEFGAIGKKVNVNAIRSMRTAFLRTGAIGDDAGYDELITKVQQEWEDDGNFDMFYFIATAQKP